MHVLYLSSFEEWGNALNAHPPWLTEAHEITFSNSSGTGFPFILMTVTIWRLRPKIFHFFSASWDNHPTSASFGGKATRAFGETQFNNTKKENPPVRHVPLFINTAHMTSADLNYNLQFWFCTFFMLKRHHRRQEAVNQAHWQKSHKPPKNTRLLAFIINCDRLIRQILMQVCERVPFY